MTSTPSKTHFQFNKQLWYRFIAIAQPYFYPNDRRGTAIFVGLLAVLLTGVMAVTFFLTAGLTTLGQWLFPQFFTHLAAGLVEQMNRLLMSPVPYIALGVLLISGLIVAALRGKLQPRWRQWSLLGCLLFLSFAVNGLNVSLSYVFRFVDNALNQKDASTFWQFLTVYAAIIVIAIPILVMYRYIRPKLALFWREWLTHYFLDRYFRDRAYYLLDSNTVNTEIDNPDQRVTEDIKAFTKTTLEFLLDILDSFLTLVSFTAILFSISKLLTLGLVLYAMFGTVVALLIGKRLIRINYDQLRLEANFRYGMVHVRDHAESIAFYRGEARERQQVVERLGVAVRNFNLLLIWQALIDLFQYGYNYFTRIVPYLIVAPLYFAGETDFGTFAQASIAFSQVLSALSLVTNRIDRISEFAASINRLGAFYERLYTPTSPGGEQHADAITIQSAPGLAIDHLTLLTPNAERMLVKDLVLDLDPGERLLIVGTSGCGKSSLLRAIAGLWTKGQGMITRPDVGEIMFLPQRPYMILGTLREQLLYPKSHVDIPDDTLYAVLRSVNLDDLPDRMGGMDVEKDWASVLSLGEQQRLALARLLLTRPRYAMLDEATSALDAENERRLYELLQSMNIVYVSVGHRQTLLDYHQKVLELDAQSGWRLFDAHAYSYAFA